MATSSNQTYTIRRLNEMVNNSIIDLSPVWQRGSVWKIEQKQTLIDSFEGENKYPIPSITLWARPGGKYIMVDGKQRTEALRDFISGTYTYNKELYSAWSADHQESFLDNEIQVRVFNAGVDEDYITEYFERINSESKQLSNGEMINASIMKPIVSTINTLFFQPGPFQEEWAEVFTTPDNEVLRKKYLENTVPYLTSSLHNVQYLTKSYPVIAPILKETSQQELTDHLPQFAQRIIQLLSICKSILEEYPDLKNTWCKHGLPPLRQVSPIWLSILEPQRIQGDLVAFWTAFYKTMSEHSEIRTRWELHMRKNGKPTQLGIEISYAKENVN
jgi:hypothetical protein